MPILAVAPHWGAWIETPSIELREAMAVAPHWGAWIETVAKSVATDVQVAPHWGAWIENRITQMRQHDRRTPLGCVD